MSRPVNKFNFVQRAFRENLKTIASYGLKNYLILRGHRSYDGEVRASKKTIKRLFILVHYFDLILYIIELICLKYVVNDFV